MYCARKKAVPGVKMGLTENRARCFVFRNRARPLIRKQCYRLRFLLLPTAFILLNLVLWPADSMLIKPSSLLPPHHPRSPGVAGGGITQLRWCVVQQLMGH